MLLSCILLNNKYFRKPGTDHKKRSVGAYSNKVADRFLMDFRLVPLKRLKHNAITKLKKYLKFDLDVGKIFYSHIKQKRCRIKNS